MTNGWGGGYVTDINYDTGYYREQSPGQLRLACLLTGCAWDVPEEGAHYMELGCGQGFGALVIAASNPSWRVTAVDFNPGQVAAARQLASEAGIGNVTFFDADLSGFADSAEAAALPDVDLVTAHGVWSWVAPQVRQGIVRLLAKKLRAGGVAHLSYNALPGWQGLLAVQRVVREAGLRLAGRSDRQAEAGIAVIRELAAAEAQVLKADARLGPWMASVSRFSTTYLAHEFMNAHWSPCWHADVCADMAQARLDWVGSAVLPQNFPELMMTGPQRIVHDRFEDPQMRELLKDMCVSRTLRHDVFIRGARRISAAARDAALRETTLALSVPATSFQYEMQVSAGKAEMSQDFYRPVVDMLAAGPARISDLLHAPGAVATRENPAELAGLLVGTNQAIAVPRPDAPPGEAVLRLNAAVIRRMAVTENLNRPLALASQSLGAGLPCSTIDLFVAGRALAGEADGDVAAWTAELAAGLNEENADRVAAGLTASRETVLPLMRQLRCLPA